LGRAKTKITEGDVNLAHKHSSNHRAKLQQDSRCGCFYCLRVFDPKEIVAWVDDLDGTAVCPYCGIDSILGESSGFPIAEEFLKKMRAHWFSI